MASAALPLSSSPSVLLQPGAAFLSRPDNTGHLRLPSRSPLRFRCHKISASISPSPLLAAKAPDDLISSILSKVRDSDRGVLLSKDAHREVAEVAERLRDYCVDEPVKSPLIFGGGGYRSAFGRLILKTNQMVQSVEAPATVRNRVAFTAFGFLDGEVSLKGKLIVLDEKWIQVIFEPPELKIGALDFRYGGESKVKLEITYIDEKIRVGKGSRGALFVFQRRG